MAAIAVRVEDDLLPGYALGEPAPSRKRKRSGGPDSNSCPASSARRVELEQSDGDSEDSEDRWDLF